MVRPHRLFQDQTYSEFTAFFSLKMGREKKEGRDLSLPIRRRLVGARVALQQSSILRPRTPIVPPIHC